MTASVYMFARLDEGGPGFTPREREELSRLRARFRDLFAGSLCGEAMLFRIVRAERPLRRALRRRVEDVLTFYD